MWIWSSFFENQKKILQIHKIKKCLLVYTRIYESLGGCRTMVIFAFFCKVGALERNAYWIHVKLIFIVIFGQSFKLDARA